MLRRFRAAVLDTPPPVAVDAPGVDCDSKTFRAVTSEQAAASSQRGNHTRDSGWKERAGPRRHANEHWPMDHLFASAGL